jgi:uncharacterized protein
MKRLILTVLLISISLTTNALALEVPSRPIGRISDYTKTLKTKEIKELEQTLAQFERETTNQIAVVLIPTLAGDNLEDYSIRLADKWKIGQKGKDNGVILLIVKQDRKIRIEVGYGLEGALPDSRAGEIIRKNIAPYFRQSNFSSGIRNGIFAIMTATGGEHREVDYRRPAPKSPGENLITSPRDRDPLAYWLEFILLPILFITFLAMTVFAILDIFGGFGAGGGFGGGGFSGGGGGFGGGGASGGW